MNKFTFKLILLFSFGFTAIPAKGDDFEATSKYYDSLFDGSKANQAGLAMFINQMPKGGDLHHHYSGTIYAETYLDWVKEKKWLIDSCTLTIVKEAKPEQKGDCSLLTVDQLIADKKLYRKLLSLWSNKDYGKFGEPHSPDDEKFFDTFGFFYPVMDEYTNIGLNIIKNRAIAENVSYIETMLTSTGVYSLGELGMNDYLNFNNQLRSADSQAATDKVLDQLHDRLMKEAEFNQAVGNYISKVEKYHQGIDDDDFTLRYQTYALRILEPVMVFKDLLSGHIACTKSPLVVGVNILGPENNNIALKDYTLHMRMFNYLSKKYPNVKKSLHSGELTLGMVRPKDLKFHITQAHEIAGADRIGHGIGLMYEQEAPSLVKKLKENSVIEINLTSNQFILGVKDQAHPYLIYSDFNVPLVISTDDSGVSRSTLSNEFLLLASRYQPSYQQIKTYVYNSIEYSFLEDKEKSRLKTQLDSQFAGFEKTIAGLISSE